MSSPALNLAVPPTSSDIAASPSIARSGALLPSPAAFADFQHDFLLSLAPDKRTKALVDAPTYAAIRAVLRDVDSTSSAGFRLWVRRNFCLSDDAKHIMHEDKRVARSEDIHAILCAAHVICLHGGPDATLKEVRERWRFVPEDLVAGFVDACPTCALKKRSSSSVAPQLTPPRTHFPAVPRLLISPVSESYLPIFQPASSAAAPLAVPLGSPTTELLTGFTPPRRAIPRAVPAGPRPIPGADITIPLDPALALYPAPPPRSGPTLAKREPLTNIRAVPAPGPPPRPARSPLRPPARRIAPPARAVPPSPIDVRAANMCMPSSCDVTCADTPSLLSACHSTGSEPSLPPTPASAFPAHAVDDYGLKGSFVRSLLRTNGNSTDASCAELPPGNQDLRIGFEGSIRASVPPCSRTSTEHHASCNEAPSTESKSTSRTFPALWHIFKRAAPAPIPGASTPKSARAGVIPPTPPSAASVWSQDSAPRSAHRDGNIKDRDAMEGAQDEDAYDGDAELEEHDGESCYEGPGDPFLT